ncbi:MAG: peptidoglycan recognition family protein [Pseudomonadota bacterium]
MSLGTRANRFEARPTMVIAALALTASAITLAIACPATAADELDGIVTRDAWGAKPGNAKIMKRQTPREIIIHMTGVRMQPKISLERKMRGLQGYSQRRAKIGRRFRRAWGDIPYHYYIGVSGRVAKGRDINFAGDTNTKYDVSDRIQVVVEGEFSKQRPRAAQLKTLVRLTKWLAQTYGIKADKISGHNDHAATSCPGKNLKAFLPKLRAAVAG